MKAIVTRMNEDGTFDKVGMNNRYVTSHYKTVSGLIRYGVPKSWKKAGVRIEVIEPGNAVICNIVLEGII